MSTYEKEIARIEALVENVRAIRDGTCEPKDHRYQARSTGVSGLEKAPMTSLAHDAPSTSAHA